MHRTLSLQIVFDLLGQLDQGKGAEPSALLLAVLTAGPIADYPTRLRHPDRVDLGLSVIGSLV